MQLATSAGFLSFSIDEELAGIKIPPKQAIAIMLAVTIAIKFIGALLG